MDGFKEKYRNKIGILLTNLGTPDAPTKKDVKKYLNQFLMDRRVVDLNRLLWIPILKLIILRIRPKKSAKLYKSIWTKDGSPLLSITKKILTKLQSQIDDQDCEYIIDIGMRYGNPSISDALNNFKDNNISKILIFPLYPQAGSPTTSSTFDFVSKVLKEWPWVPELRFINGYHDNSDYIKAISKTIEKSYEENGRPEKTIISFHGMPKRYLDMGDPYYCFCHKTARLVSEELKLKDSEYTMAFQSRFGREEWLQPYLDDVIQTYAQEGIKKVHIISPGFSADCLETLEEINIQYKKLFIKYGGEALHYIPCLNDNDSHILMMKNIIINQTKGW